MLSGGYPMMLVAEVMGRSASWCLPYFLARSSVMSSCGIVVARTTGSGNCAWGMNDDSFGLSESRRIARAVRQRRPLWIAPHKNSSATKPAMASMIDSVWSETSGGFGLGQISGKLSAATTTPMAISIITTQPTVVAARFGSRCNTIV
jgi:hypothetical protein